MTNTKLQKNKSFAKINLFLSVLNRRNDGYHNISSIFQKIDLFDELTFSPNDTIEITGNTTIPMKDNIIYMSAVILNQFTQYDYGIKIDIQKHIPIGAGLGGGSSNAATTLLTLNEMWALHLSQSELLQIGAKLGADVPFFLHETSAALVSGIGEIIEPLTSPINGYYLLVYPNININTGKAYAMLNRTTTYTSKTTEQLYSNDFEEVLCREYAELETLRHKLHSITPDSSMSGSGSSFFAIFSEESDALLAQREFAATNYQVFVGKIL